MFTVVIYYFQLILLIYWLLPEFCCTWNETNCCWMFVCYWIYV